MPPDLPKPGQAGHSLQVADFVASTARVIGGRTLVLTTSLRALQTVSEALQRQFAQSQEIDILVQGQQPKARVAGAISPR